MTDPPHHPPPSSAPAPSPLGASPSPASPSAASPSPASSSSASSSSAPSSPAPSSPALRTRPLPLLDVPNTALAELRDAKRALREAEDLLQPGAQGRLGCGLAGAYAGTVVLSGVVLVAPCTLGLMVPLAPVAALLGLLVGAVVGVPAVVRLSRRVRAKLYRRALATIEHRALPDRAGGGSSTTAAVSPAVDRDER